MRRFVSYIVILAMLFLAPTAFAQGATSTGNATCNFDEDKQLAVEYQHVALNPKKPVEAQVPFGRCGRPAASP